MHASPHWFWATVLLAGLLAYGSRADNPRVTLTPGTYTAAEAVDTLSRASGVPLQLSVPAPRPGQPISESQRLLQEPQKLEWQEMAFARALRLICERYKLSAYQFNGVYRLRQGPLPPGPAGRVAEAEGLTFYLSQLSVQNHLVMDFRQNPKAAAVPRNTQLQVTLEVDLGDGDAETVIGLDEITAKDNQGTLLLGRGHLTANRLQMPTSLPDTWTGMATLSGPHPRATRLEWLEGTLFGFSKVSTASVDVDLPLGAPFKAQALGPLTLQALELRSGGPGGEAGLPQRPEVLLRVSRPLDLRELSPLPNLRVWLVGESGKRYGSGGNSTNGTSRDGMMVWNGTYSYADVPERVTRIRVEVKQPSAPKPLGRFKFLDLPLPREGIFVAQAAEPQPPFRAAPAPAERAFYRNGGATLVSPVRIQGAPAPAGTLFLGLSRRDGAEMGQVRWLEVDVRGDGSATLEDLEPGVYRVYRTYRPSQIPNLPGPGNWRGGEAEIRAEAGKTFTLPPLAWERDAPAPRPAAKPAKSPPKRR